MTRGPAPKPVELKILEGNPGQRRLPNVPKYAPLSAEPPDWLAPEAKREWKWLMSEFDRVSGLVCRPDRSAMIALCSEWAKYVEATRVMNDPARCQRIGGKAAHQVAREALTALLALWQRFGLTPGDRSRFDLPKGDDDKDPRLQLLD